MTRRIEAFRAAPGHLLTEPEMRHFLLGALKRGYHRITGGGGGGGCEEADMFNPRGRQWTKTGWGFPRVRVSI